MAGVPSLDEAGLERALDAPGLLVLGLDLGQGVDRFLADGQARHPRTRFARLEVKRHANLAYRSFGPFEDESVLIILGRVILLSYRAAEIGPKTLDEQLEFSAGADPREMARRSLGAFGEPGPEGESEFKVGFDGIYRHSSIDSWRLVIGSRGDCRHEDIQVGLQGSSSDIKEGRWTRRPDGCVELRWTRETSDLELGTRTDRESKGVDRLERIRLRWEGAKVAEIRFEGDALPGAVPPRDSYLRRE